MKLRLNDNLRQQTPWWFKPKTRKFTAAIRLKKPFRPFPINWFTSRLLKLKWFRRILKRFIKGPFYGKTIENELVENLSNQIAEEIDEEILAEMKKSLTK